MKKKLLMLAVLLLPALCFGQAQVQITGTLVVQARNMSVTFPSSFSRIYENVPYSSLINVTGGIGPYTCTLSSGSLPAGTSITDCLLSGTPTGTSTVTSVILATDSLGQTATGSITLTTASLSSIAVTGSSLNVAVSATQQLMGTGTWSDGTTSDLTTTCTWSSGTPGKATIGSATGLVTGVAAGTSLMSCVFNAITGSATVTCTANPAVSTSSPLANAQVNLPYPPLQLQATGGTPPFTWAVTVGTLPTGLSLNSTTGVISGTPTGTTQTFSVVATDSLSVATAAKSLLLTVATVSSNAVVCTPSTIQAGSTSQCVSTTTFSDASTADTSMGSTLARVNTARASNATGSLVASLQTSAFVATAGNLLIVGARHGTDFVSAITVTDTAGNTFTAIGSLTVNSPNLGVGQMFYAKNITGNAADQVTCTFAASTAYNDCIVLQISGADASAPLDVHSETGVGAAATNSCISGSITTTVANEALVSYCTAASLNAVFSPGAGYNVDVQDADGLGAIESKIVSAIQTSVTANTSFNGAAKQTIGLVASFKAGASAGAAWSSGTNSTATVNGQGLVTGLVGGTSSISAVYGGQTGSATVTVTGGAVTAITVIPATISGPNGSTQQFVARDQNNFDITNSVTWASTTISCVTMNPTGLATVVSSTACGSANNITATSGQISGFATFTGTGTPATQSLLPGCTVSSSNVPSCATPAGWTLVQGVAFEDGTLGVGGNNAGFGPIDINCTVRHSGNCSVHHKIVRGDDTGMWASQTWSGTKDTYISFWEFDDATGSMATDFTIAGVKWPIVPGGTDSYWIDGNSPLGCNPGQWPGMNIKTNRFLMIYGLGGLQTWGVLTNCIAPNAPSWGNWTQWEFRIKINDPTAFGNNSNGEFQLYENGVLILNMPSGYGACSSADLHCSNMVGTANYNLYNHFAWIGGVSTARATYKAAPHIPANCSTATNDFGTIDFPEFTLQSFDSQDPCPGQAPPNGWPLNTIPGGFNRYWDDIIVLKR